MFRQVIFTLFLLMDRYYEFWSGIVPSEAVPSFGSPGELEVQRFAVDTTRMIRIFREGFDHFGVFWQKVVRPENFSRLKELSEMPDGDFYLPTEIWAKLVYDYSATFHAWERHRRQLVDTMSPLYYARVASFVGKTKDMSNVEAEEVVEDQADQFVVSWMLRSNEIRTGTVLSTGTGIIQRSARASSRSDVVTLSCPQLGELANPVAFV